MSNVTIFITGIACGVALVFPFYLAAAHETRKMTTLMEIYKKAFIELRDMKKTVQEIKDSQIDTTE